MLSTGVLSQGVGYVASAYLYISHFVTCFHLCWTVTTFLTCLLLVHLNWFASEAPWLGHGFCFQELQVERVPSDLGKDNAEETASNTTENEEVKCQRPGGKVQMHPFKMQTEIRRNYFRIIINYQFSTFYTIKKFEVEISIIWWFFCFYRGETTSCQCHAIEWHQLWALSSRTRVILRWGISEI